VPKIRTLYDEKTFKKTLKKVLTVSEGHAIIVIVREMKTNYSKGGNKNEKNNDKSLGNI